MLCKKYSAHLILHSIGVVILNVHLVVDTIMAKSDEVKEIDGIVEFINKTYSANCKKILITGSGDPFASKSFRKFLFNFQPSQWPELKSVQLITNGKLLMKRIGT